MKTAGFLKAEDQTFILLLKDIIIGSESKVENGVLYFDDARWKWEPAADLALDEKNGYTRPRMLLHRLTGR